MGVWDRSWSITRLSFDVIRKDKEMLWFPILAGFFSLLFSAALLVPTFVLDVAREEVGDAIAPLQWTAAFVTYFGLAFIATFFNVCVVYTTRVRLSGGDATFMDSIKFALSRLHLILGWSLVSASVGLLLRALDSLAERTGLAGKILLAILRAVLATAWSIMTIFVVPSMVYKSLGPIDAVKDSLETLRRTWGESLVRYYGLGLAAFICSLPCFALIVGGIALSSSVAAAGVALLVVGAVGLLAVSLVFGVASTVFNTVLYQYATSGAAPAGFDQEILAGAFRPRG
jgi:hypothetical protein